LISAGHSDRVRPGPIPNPAVKPGDAAAILTCESGRKTAVLASNHVNLYDISTILYRCRNITS
jgi:hypothetical protein